METDEPGYRPGLPLSGLVAVEIGHSIAAPYAGSILRQLGANVLKVEHPGGDPVRGWGPPFLDDSAVAFEAYNHGKASLAVDLKDGAQRAALEALILARADIVIQNLKPGAVVNFGLDAATLRAKRPELIYCNLSAFGDFGPLAMKPGYDPLIQAYAGLMNITGADDSGPARVGVSLIDMGTAMWAALGIVAALLTRQRTGIGATIDTSLYETGLAWMTLPLAAHLASGEPLRRFGSGVGQIVPYQVFPTRDGELMIAAGNDRLFAKLCAALDRPQWAADTRFTTNRQRVAHREDLIALIAAQTSRVAIADLIALLDAADIPNAPLRDARSVVADPQTLASGMIKEIAPSLHLIGLPVRFDGDRPVPTKRAPRLAEHGASGILTASSDAR